MLTKKHFKEIAGILKEARCRAFKEEFTSADAVICFFESKLIDFCLEENPLFDITKFQEASRLKQQKETKENQDTENENEDENPLKYGFFVGSKYQSQR